MEVTGFLKLFVTIIIEKFSFFLISMEFYFEKNPSKAVPARSYYTLEYHLDSWELPDLADSSISLFPPGPQKCNIFFLMCLKRTVYCNVLIRNRLDLRHCFWAQNLSYNNFQIARQFYRNYIPARRAFNFFILGVEI